MNREHYFTVEGPQGKADVFEILDEGDATLQGKSFNPSYEVLFNGRAETYSSEGEAITVAQQLVGAPSSY